MCSGGGYWITEGCGDVVIRDRRASLSPGLSLHWQLRRNQVKGKLLTNHHPTRAYQFMGRPNDLSNLKEVWLDSGTYLILTYIPTRRTYTGESGQCATFSYVILFGENLYLIEQESLFPLYWCKEEEILDKIAV